VGLLNHILVNDDLLIGLEVDSVLKTLPDALDELDLLALLLTGQVSLLDVRAHILLDVRRDFEVLHRRVGKVDAVLESVLLLPEDTQLG
jgi:hypothetical protein